MNIIIAKNPKIQIYNLPDDISNLIMSYIDLWTYISESVYLSPVQLETYQDFINWRAYSLGVNELNYNIIKNHYKEMNWSGILNKWVVTHTTDLHNKILQIPLKYVHFINIAKCVIFNDKACFNIISTNKTYFYSMHFIDCFPSYLDWDWIIINIKFTSNAILKYFNFISVAEERNLYKYQNLTDIELLNNLQDQINWTLFSIYQELTLSHYLIFHRKLCWNYIFKKKELSHYILNRLPMYIIYDHLDLITKTQPLDDEFITNNIKILDPRKICNNEKIDEKIKKRIFKNCQSNKYILLLNNNTYTEFS